jgi:hypothetical protein
MLRGNLSTRPFYNERAVQVGLTVVAVVLGVLTIFTVWQLWALTAQQRELGTRIARDEARAADLRREASRVRGRIDPQLLESTVRATREANRVIDARTFSWTALFNVLERTMPPDIRLQSVTPVSDGESLNVRLVINAKRVEPVGVFMDRLEEAGAFDRMVSVEEAAQEDGSLNIVCEGRYLGPGAPPAVPAEEPAEAGGDGAATSPGGMPVTRAGAR